MSVSVSRSLFAIDSPRLRGYPLRVPRLQARMTAGHSFVEFGTEFQATRAMESLQGFKVTPSHSINVTYAKK